MASNEIIMQDSTINDTVTSKEVAVPKPKDNVANVALHKERYLHYIEEKYFSRPSTSTAMLKAKGEIFVDIIEGRSKGTPKLKWIINKRNLKVKKIKK